MALDKERLKNNLKAAYVDAAANGGESREEQLEYFCEKLSDVLIDEMKQLKINYSNGLTAGANAVVGTLNHTVS